MTNNGKARFCENCHEPIRDDEFPDFISPESRQLARRCASCCFDTLWYFVENVDKFEELDKSERLLRLTGLLPTFDGGVNLYDPANMALAWRVLNWIDSSSEFGDEFQKYWSTFHLWAEPPEAAIQDFLDRVLELAKLWDFEISQDE